MSEQHEEQTYQHANQEEAPVQSSEVVESHSNQEQELHDDKKNLSNNDETEIVNDNRDSTDQDILVSSQRTEVTTEIVVSENEPAQPESGVSRSNDESHVLVESQVTNNLGNSEYVVKSESQEEQENKEEPKSIEKIETESPKNVELSHVDSVTSPAKRNEENVQLDNVEIKEEQTEAKPAQEGAQEEDLPTRINKAVSLKEAAKPFVKGGLYNEAIKVYESAFYALKMTAQDSASPHFRQCLILQNDIFNNMSLCYSNLGLFKESIAYSKRVLMIESENIKALFRVAIGYKSLGDNLTAYDEIQKCKEAYKKQNPGAKLDPKIHELYLSLKESCKEAIEAREKKEKELFSKMMGNKKDAKEEEKSPEEKKSDKKRLAIAKSLTYGPFISHSVILGIIANRIVQEGSLEGAKKLLPAFVASLCGILFTKFTQNQTSKNILGFGLAAAAAFMIPKFTK